MGCDGGLDWLLEEDNPPVRLMTLTQLLRRDEDDDDVRTARASLMDYSVTQAILAHHREVWESGPRQFWSYQGKHWNTVFLGQFLANGRDSRLTQGLQELAGVVWPNCGAPCMAACMLRALKRLGYGEHPEVVRGNEALARSVLEDGGITCQYMASSLLSRCYMALPKLLLCFTELAEETRSRVLQDATTWITRGLTDHQVFVYAPENRKDWDAVRPKPRTKGDVPEGETRASWVAKAREQYIAERGLGGLQPKPSWTRFGFPLNYNSDILEAMFALALANAPMSPSLERPLQVIKNKQTPNSRWLMDRSLNGKMWADVEAKGMPSKWITLFAMIVLDHFGEGR